jgi:N-acetyl-gamma-glutamyl-phosphate reductase
MSTRVFVDGQEGTTGLRINEYLAQRSDVEVLRAAPGAAQGHRRARPPAQCRRHRLPLPARRGGTGGGGAGARTPNTCLIDASTAHRTAGDWVYGLPELAPDQSARLRATKRISNPGCIPRPSSCWFVRSSMPA